MKRVSVGIGVIRKGKKGTRIYHTLELPPRSIWINSKDPKTNQIPFKFNCGKDIP